jgi:proline iminopeptidase
MPPAPSPAPGLFHVTHGEGRPLLAIHGGPGLDHAHLRPWLDALGVDATVVYADLRGCGQSRQPDPTDGLDHAGWVADLDALREQLGFERWAVLGTSHGAALALEYAHLHPERVEALVLVGAFPSLSHAEAALPGVREHATPEQWEALVDTLSRPRVDDAELEASFRTLAPLYFHRPTPERLAALLDAGTFSAQAYNSGALTCLREFDARPWLHEITLPVLLVHGRHDRMHPPELTAAPLAEGLRQAELVVFEESGHYPFIEEPERFARVVGRWLREHPAEQEASA